MVVFAVESWIWFGFAVGMIIVRLISRTLLFRGVSGLQYDDWIMGLFVASCYTVLIVMLNAEAGTRSNLLSPIFDMASLTPQDIADREYGSKIVIVVEQMQIAVIWACKACLLILYHRLTHMVAPAENMAVKLLALYVVLGFVVMEILYFAAWCRPFSEYWAVPTKSSQCNALINHRITNAVFNISSDFMMLCIALPMFIRSLLPFKRKLILCCIFSLGIFAITAAVLNKYYSFTKPYEPTWIYWYCRESSTVILVANLPFTWTLLRKLFTNLGAFDEERPTLERYRSSRTARGKRTVRARTQPMASSNGEKYSDIHNSGPAVDPERSMSLIESLCVAKGKRHERLSDNSQYSENGLMGVASIRTRDFATPPTLNSTAHDTVMDMERGLCPSSSSSTSNPLARPMPLSHFAGPHRSPSPTHTYDIRHSIDNTLCPLPTTNSHPTPPSRAHLSLTPSHSRPLNRASVSTNPTAAISPIASSILRTGTTVGRRVGTRGGISARDRRARARLTQSCA